MPYTDKTQVETWSQENGTSFSTVGYDYVNTIAYVISVADRAIDSECEVPEEFFVAGGVEIVELHDGVDLGWVSSWVENPYTMTNAQPLLRLKYKPVLNVTSVESKSSAGAWATLTANTDYVADPLGVRFLTNVPRYSYGNIRVTYKAGYAATPSKIRDVSTQLAASIIQRIIDSKLPHLNASVSTLSIQGPLTEFVGFAESCFTDSLKAELQRFRNVVPPKVV